MKAVDLRDVPRKRRTGCALGILLVVVPWSAGAQGPAIRAVPTYENIGLHVAFETDPPPGTTLRVSVKEEGTSGDYRPAHPLSRIAPGRFAGSVFHLRPDTAYSLRLSSAALPGDRLLGVRTRSESWTEPTRGVLHVAPDGDDAEERDGRTRATAFRTLRRALETVMAGETIRLHPGRYLEGDIEAYPLSSGAGEGTAENPIGIEGTPEGPAVLDGSDPDFAPQWEAYDAAAGVYRTATDREPYHAYLNGGHLYRFGVLDHLRTNRWNQASGFFADGRHLYVRLPGGQAPGTNRVTISRFTYALNLGASHYRIRDLEFCYYGYGREPGALSLDNASSNVIERCTFHHTGMGVSLRHDSSHNTIQHCSFSEWPVDTFSWDAIKQGEPFGSEPYESGGVVVYGEHTAGAYSGNVIRFNRFERMFDGVHLMSDEQDAPTEDLDFHDNRIANCGDDAIETDGVGSNCRIYRNVLTNFLTGISVAPAALGPTYIFRNTLVDWRSVPTNEGEDGRFLGYPIKLNHQMREDPWTQWVFLYHNTCVTREPGLDGFVFSYYWWFWTNIVARNNIFVGTHRAILNVNDRCPIDFDYDNLFTTHPTAFAEWPHAPFPSLAEFTRATGQETHGLSADPRFVGPSDFRLQPDSPLIDRGIPIPGINDGFAGLAPDIGALEHAPADSDRPSAVASVLDGGLLRTTWQAAAGTTWQLEFADALDPARWTGAGGVQTADAAGRLEFSHPASGPAGFLRLRSAPP